MEAVIHYADPEQLTSESPDIELLWNIQLLSYVCHHLAKFCVQILLLFFIVVLTIEGFKFHQGSVIIQVLGPISNGAALLEYADSLLQCLKPCSHLKSKPAAKDAAVVHTQLDRPCWTHFSGCLLTGPQ